MASASATDEAERVFEMRVERLLDLELTYQQALELAMSEAELHKAEEMVSAGCSGELLLAILT